LRGKLPAKSYWTAGAVAKAPSFCKVVKSSKVMGDWPETPGVTWALVGALAEVSVASVDGAAGDVVVEVAAVSGAAATVVSGAVVLAEREAQPARVRPAAMSENKTEILIFVVSVFMAKCLVSWGTKWFLSKNNRWKNTDSFWGGEIGVLASIGSWLLTVAIRAPRVKTTENRRQHPRAARSAPRLDTKTGSKK